MAEAIYRGGETEFDDEDLRALIDLYDAEIRSFDDEFARLYRHLESLGILDRTVLVFLSDHGEAFLEHDHFLHCRTVYDNEAKTPLFFRVPGVVGKRISSSVSNIDILPSILDFLDIKRPNLTFEGRSLRRLFTSSEQKNLPVFTSQNHQRSLTEGSYKLVFDLKNDHWELFHLDRDPEEKSDLSGSEPDRVSAMRQRLNRWIDQVEGSRAESLQRSSDSQDLLKALGYLQ